ncbi:AAA family ATPase [Nocardioides sp. YIM 152588]|uniref:AAA family ATPase n=1 Tax=Nocardioides sp. YIM 152588 TaxID=3158259 RepID=UPI0032E4BEC2
MAPPDPPEPHELLDDYQAWVAELQADRDTGGNPVPTSHDLAADDAVVPGASWLPIDLGPIVDGLADGTLQRLEPTVGSLDGGGCIFYAGKVNGVAGESGSGKTWTALAVAAQELTEGRAVVYLDLEDDAAGIVGRLLDLGVDPEAVRAAFAYIRPDWRLDEVARSLLVDLLADRRPALAVVDSTGEGLALDGANPNADEEVARWFRRLPRLLASTGAAVVVLDHTAKAADGGLWPIGSQRKRAAIDGAQYMQETIRPFAKDTAGLAVLKCAKDRHGTYRAGQRVAELTVDPEPTGGVQVALRAAQEAATTAAGGFRPTGYMERISDALALAEGALTYNDIRDRVTGKKEHIRTAVNVLVVEGYVTTAPGPRRSTLHTLARPFREDDTHPPTVLGEPGTSRGHEVAPSTGPTGPGPKGGDRGTSGLTGPGDQSGTSGDQSYPCPNPHHSPQLLAGRWACDDCTQMEVAS